MFMWQIQLGPDQAWSRKDQGKYFGPAEKQKEQKVLVKSRLPGLVCHQIMWMEEKSTFPSTPVEKQSQKNMGSWDQGGCVRNRGDKGKEEWAKGTKGKRDKQSGHREWGMSRVDMRDEQSGQREGGMSKGDKGKEGWAEWTKGRRDELNGHREWGMSRGDMRDELNGQREGGMSTVDMRDEQSGHREGGLRTVEKGREEGASFFGSGPSPSPESSTKGCPAAPTNPLWCWNIACSHHLRPCLLPSCGSSWHIQPHNQRMCSPCSATSQLATAPHVGKPQSSPGGMSTYLHLLSAPKCYPLQICSLS